MGLKSEDSITAQIQTIQRFALALRDAAGASSQLSHTSITPSPRAMIDSISLPSPPPLLPFLLQAGLSHDIAAAASKVYQLRSDELRQHVQESIVTACHKIAELPMVALASSPDSFIRNVVSTFTEVYLRRLEQWKEEIIQRIKQASKTTTNEAPKNSRTFNHEYVPLLEHFFEENPFPTHADKVFLAKKSSMQYRQIHVWFQNRRNRTKREVKPLRKKPIHEGATKPLDRLYEQMKGHMVIPTFPSTPQPSQATCSEGNDGMKISQKDVSRDVFALPPPLHAFPSSYPPACDYDPFPCKSGPTSFGEPEWRRVSCGEPPHPIPISICDLAEKFSQLNVRCDVRSKGSPKLQLHAATAAITVIPSCAPHPSMIISKQPHPTRIVTRYPSVPSSSLPFHVFQSPSPTSKPVTLVPLPVPLNKSELPGNRKTAPLPQRFPGRMRNTRRGTTPSESSSTSSSSPRLFSTDSESRSCSFSSVSSLSTPSDVPSIQELPHSFGSPCRSLFESPIHYFSDIFRDALANPPSPVS